MKTLKNGIENKQNEDREQAKLEIKRKSKTNE